MFTCSDTDIYRRNNIHFLIFQIPLSPPLITFSFPLDAEDFLAEGLQNENLSPGAQDQRDHILRGFQQIRSRFVSASFTVLFQLKKKNQTLYESISS